MLVLVLFWFLTEVTMKCRRAPYKGAKSIPLYQVTDATAESFMVPVLDVSLTPQHVN